MKKSRELTAEERAIKERKETPIEIDVISDWQPWYFYPLRVLLLMLGIPLFIGGALMMVTIILILPGLGTMAFGAFMIVGACLGIQKERCLECDKYTYLIKLKQNQDCLKCKQKYKIKWTAKFVSKREQKSREFTSP